MEMPVTKTVMVPMPVAPVQQMYAPVSYNQELRGVGIKFGERIDPRTGGMRVYVKRLVKGGPADLAQQIQPGDTLQLINGEDVYGLGLDVLRERIPGPAGTRVRLGFRTMDNRFYEVDLQRSAYGNEQPEAASEQIQPNNDTQYYYVPKTGQYIKMPAQQQQPAQPQMPQPAPPQPQMRMQQPMPIQQTIMQPVQRAPVQYVQQQPQMVQYVQQPQPVQYVQQQPQVQYIQEQPQQAPVQYVQAQPQQVLYPFCH